MKVVISGSRTIPEDEYNDVEEGILASGFEITELVQGGAIGVDRLAYRFAVKHNIPSDLTKWKPDWKKHGRWMAGKIRNNDMCLYVAPDGALVAIWDGTSGGTRNAIANAIWLRLKVFVWNMSKPRVARGLHVNVDDPKVREWANKYRTKL